MNAIAARPGAPPFRPPAGGKLAPQLVVTTPAEPMNPVATPSGDTYVFADGTSQWPGLTRDVYTVKADGSELKKLTNRSELSWMPAVDPAGERIAYVVEHNGHSDLHLMNLDGTDDKNLTRTNAGYWEPQWSPDGQHILVCTRETGNLELALVAADGSGTSLLTKGADNRAARFTPDGSRIAFLSNRSQGYDQLFSMKADGSDLRKHSEGVMALQEPTLSPDGSTAVFSAVDPQSNIDIYSVKLDGSEPMKQLEFSGMAMSPTFSPDGRMIAYLGPNPGETTFQIQEMEADGSNASALTEGDVFHLGPTYLPDGKSLLFVADYDRGKSQLYKLDRGPGCKHAANQQQDY